MSFKTINFAIEDGVAHIELNRPKSANTVDPALAAELLNVARQCESDESVRAVLLSGAGPIFCAGGDLAAFSSFGDELPSAMESMLKDFHPAVELLSTMSAPVITAVQGSAAGAGLSLVAASSFAVASSSARFVMAYTGAGLTPDGSSTYYLPRLIGLRRTEELMLTNRRLSAAEALDWGIVNQVVEESELMEKAQQLAARLAQGPTRAFGNVRRMLLDSFDSPLSEQLQREGESIVDMARSADGREGISAFLEKRRPVFSGHQ